MQSWRTSIPQSIQWALLVACQAAKVYVTQQPSKGNITWTHSKYATESAGDACCPAGLLSFCSTTSVDELTGLDVLTALTLLATLGFLTGAPPFATGPPFFFAFFPPDFFLFFIHFLLLDAGTSTMWFCKRHSSNGLFSKTSWYRFGILTRQEMMGFWDGSSISQTICKQPAHYRSIFTSWMLFLMPNQQCETLKAKIWFW